MSEREPTRCNYPEQMAENDQLREERDNIGALAARRLDEIDRLREALREIAAPEEPADHVCRFPRIARAALGDTPDE
jgi:hypothetical protein